MVEYSWTVDIVLLWTFEVKVDHTYGVLRLRELTTDHYLVTSTQNYSWTSKCYYGTTSLFLLWIEPPVFEYSLV